MTRNTEGDSIGKVEVVYVVTSVRDALAAVADARRRNTTSSVLCSTLEVTQIMRQAGLVCENPLIVTRSMSPTRLIRQAGWAAWNWMESPAFRSHPAFSEFLRPDGIPLARMHYYHVRSWLFEAMISLEVLSRIMELRRPGLIIASPPLTRFDYWHGPGLMLDSNAAELIGRRRGIPVEQFTSDAAAAGDNAESPAAEYAGPAAARRVMRALRNTAYSLASFALDTVSMQSAATDVLFVTGGAHYRDQMMPVTRFFRDRLSRVGIGLFDSAPDVLRVELFRRGISLQDIQSPSDPDEREAVSRALIPGRKAHAALLGDPELSEFFATEQAGNYWPVIQGFFERLLTEDIPATYGYLVRARRILDRNEPRMLITGTLSSDLETALVLEARRRAIPTMAIMHGAINRPYQPLFMFATEQLVLWGEETRKSMERFPPNAGRIVAAGCPLFENRWKSPAPSAGLAESGRSLGLRPDQPVCLALTTIFPTGDVYRYADEAVYRALFRLVEDAPGLQLIVRAHAGEPMTPLREMAGEYAGKIVISPPLSLAELLKLSHVVITQTTSAGFEAILADKPLIYLNLESEEDWLPFAESGAALKVTQAAALPAAVDALLHDADIRERLRERRRSFIASELCALDGRSCERIFEAATSLMKDREAMGASKYRTRQGGESGFEDWLARGSSIPPY